jgi:hypothetical protein
MSYGQTIEPKCLLEEKVDRNGWTYRTRKLSQDEEFGNHWVCEVKYQNKNWSSTSNLYQGKKISLAFFLDNKSSGWTKTRQNHPTPEFDLSSGHAATWDIHPPYFTGDDFLEKAAICEVLRKILEDEFRKEYVPVNIGETFPIGDTICMLNKYRAVRFWLRHDDIDDNHKLQFETVPRQPDVLVKTVKVDFRGITVQHNSTTYEGAERMCACDLLYRLILRTPWIPGHKSHIRGCLCQDCTNLP